MEAKRTLVKSPPELWAELSEVSALARHLGEFGEIRITRTEPESIVEWEGERATGSVRLEPSGWGTKVTLRADAVLRQPDPEPPAAEPEPEPPAPEPEPELESAPVKRRGFFARLFRRRRTPEPEPEPRTPTNAPPEPPPIAAAEPPPPPEPVPAIDAAAAEAVLGQVLDALGTAHHRPFSR